MSACRALTTGHSRRHLQMAPARTDHLAGN
jgi:hypothetical protein